MPVYSYKAANPEGKIIEGTLEAAEENSAVSGLHDMGYIPIRIKPTRGDGMRLSGYLSGDFLSLFKGISARDVMAFTQDLSVLLYAGLPVDRSLSILKEAAENERFRDTVDEILRNVQGGGYLSDALAKFPKVFSTFYVNMVRAGEAGGVLEAVLERLGLFLESSQDLRDYIRSAMVYPVFLVFVGGISIIILLTYVIPKFSIIFSDMGQSIPLATRLLLDLSGVLRSYWWVILGGVGAMFFFLKRYVDTRAGGMRLDRFKLDLPFGGELVKKVEVSRFARTLGTLIQSGVPILHALYLVKEIVGNRVIALSMGEICERVKEGERLSKPLAEMEIFPSLAIQMIMVGEETGRLDEMLLKVAENYEKVVRNMVKRFISLLEPAMILAMGLVVGFIVISMLMAIFSMNEMPF